MDEIDEVRQGRRKGVGLKGVLEKQRSDSPLERFRRKRELIVGTEGRGKAEGDA